MEYRDLAQQIPWASLGRETVASRLGFSLLPVTVLPYEAPPYDPAKPMPKYESKQPGFLSFLPNIIGTAIQAAPGKLVTCAHVVASLSEQKHRGYIHNRFVKEEVVHFHHRPLEAALTYIDPRTGDVNPKVDLVLIPFPAVSTHEMPYDVAAVKWGDSGQLGVGDPVMVGGYPYGTHLFVNNLSNRGFVQPTFYAGIVSAIIPAMFDHETRLIQISVAVAGGMSGGAVFNPATGEVLGMVTSGLGGGDQAPHPVTWAIPSEVIAPFVQTIGYQDKGGRIWSEDGTMPDELRS